MSTTSTPTTGPTAVAVPGPVSTDAPATPANPVTPSPGRLPVAALLALAASGFLTLLTEILPAGVLPAMAADLGVGAGAAGQTVTAFAVGAIVAAIPLTRATTRWDRRTLLLVAVAGFVVANTVTAVSSSFLTLGVPAGAVLGAAVGWRWTFGVLSVVGVALLAWIRLGVPGAAGTPRGAQLAIRAVLPRPGLRPVLLVAGLNVLANTSLYTYVAVHLAHLGQGSRTSALLLVLGAASAGALVLFGALIDHRLRALTLGSVVVFGLAMLVLGLAPTPTVVVVLAVAAWGAAFGGAGTLYTTAAARAAGDGADVAQSALVTVWNTSVALGGAVGGAALAVAGPGGLPWVSLALMVPVVATVALGRRHSFR